MTDGVQVKKDWHERRFEIRLARAQRMMQMVQNPDYFKLLDRAEKCACCSKGLKLNRAAAEA